MTTLEYFSLVYTWVIILTILTYYIAKRFLKVKRHVAIGPTYPIVKAMSIMLVAFSIRHGMIELAIPLLVQHYGLEFSPTTSDSSLEAIVFYIAVMLVAISYAWALKKTNEM